jgi:hypothetical protein
MALSPNVLCEGAKRYGNTPIAAQVADLCPSFGADRWREAGKGRATEIGSADRPTTCP